MKRLFVVGIAGLALLASGWTQLRQIQFKHEVILQRTAYTPGATSTAWSCCRWISPTM
jgi:hypothetical protein